MSNASRPHPGEEPPDDRDASSDDASSDDAGDSGGDGWVDDGDRALVWVLPPAGRWTLWALVGAAVVIVAAVAWRVAAHGFNAPAPLFAAAVVLYAALVLLRGVVAVVVDPLEGTVLLFRAAAPAVRTRLERIQRIDHGQLDAIGFSHAEYTPPPRIVTRDGTARLSWLFPHPGEVALALADLAPHAQVDL